MRDNTIVYIDYDKTKGFKVKPRNSVKYDGIKVNSLLLIKPSFIEKILKRKIKRKLELYLDYIVNIINSEDDDDSARHALNEVTRYRILVMNNYRAYLNDKYYELLMKKLDLIENELNLKLQTIEMNHFFENTSKKSR
ncbi:MAG: hypothetical protein PHE54_03815 [Bacilli bacterium]|nr:hypothetical protein [Bacilli bacterium]